MSDRNRAIDALIGMAIGAVPKVKWIATTDGGASARISFDTERELFQWITSHASLIGCTAATWEFWPAFSTDPTASKQLRDKMREEGWAWHRMDLGEMRRSIISKHNGQQWETHCADSPNEEESDSLAALSAHGIEAPQ